MKMPATGAPATPVRRPPRPGGHVAAVTRLISDDGGHRTDAVPLAAVDGTLALDLAACRGLPTAPPLRVVETSGDPDEVQVWAARFAQAVVEVLAGDRPLPQLVRWTSNRVYTDLGRRVRILGRTAPATQRIRTLRAQVRSVHVFLPVADAAEVSVHVRHGNRSRAIAARLERTEDRWRCTVLQFG